MIAAGVEPALFWRQTPRETQEHLRWLAERARRAGDQALTAAYQTAQLVRAEKLPDLEELLRRTDVVQSPEEQLNAARRIAASFGGNVRG